MNGADIREALVIRPGDTLIVRYDRSISTDQAQSIKELLTKRLPDLHDIIVLNADEIAVYRP